MEETKVDIPMDIYESIDEIFIVVPLWGVDKESIEIFLESTTLFLTGKRLSPQIKENMKPVKQDCFRGEFSRSVDLPQNVYFQKIHSRLNKNNVLEIIVPKVVIPEKVKIDIDYS